MATMETPQEQKHRLFKSPDERVKSAKQKFVFNSPNVKARVQEKEELSDLNDRLAAYIDRVRSLENQNAKLAVEITQAKDTREREVTNVKAMYETELSESRRLLDDTSKEKALLKLENNKLNGILLDLRPKLEQAQAQAKHASDKLRSVEGRLHEKENLLAVYNSERLELQARVKDLEAQLDDLEVKLAKDKDQLEKEIIGRIDAENRYQTLKEESQFTAQVHQTEVNEARQFAEQHSVNFDITDGTEYKSMLHDKLQELREEFEEEAELAKKELEDAYKVKFDELKGQGDRDRTVISKLLEKQGEFKSEIDTLKSENNVLSSKVDHFQKRIVELDSLRVMDKEEFKRQIADRDDKLSALQARYEDLEGEYETLLGIKIALDMELAAYNKLLEGEEQRLNLATPEKPIRRARKRAHKESEEEKPVIDSTASGVVSISDVDPNGTFVTITNNGSEDEEIGGHIVHRKVDASDTTLNDFKFPSGYVLQAQQSVTIWSESRGMKANPPHEFVLEGDWNTEGNDVSTTIVNLESEVIARYTLKNAEQPSDGPRKMRKKHSSRESCAVM